MSENNAPNDKIGTTAPHKAVAKDGHEYHVSSTANATVAPTNEHTIANATKTKGLNEEQAEFVTILDYEWNLQAKLDPEQIRLDYGVPTADWDKLTHDPLVLDALKLRGVPIKGLNPPERSPKEFDPVGSFTPRYHAKLTPIQLVVANALLDLTDTRSDKKKLQDAGCTTTQYNGWMRDENFRGYIQHRAEQIVGTDLKHDAFLALADRVKSGDMKAIEFYMELTGQFTRQTASSNNNGPDLNNAIVRIIEIVIDEVEDQATAQRIANRLKGLVAGHQVANSLNNPEPIEAPQIAAPRIVTPEVQELMNRGVGYDS